MPSKYTRKSQRASYSQQDLKVAVERVAKKELTNVEASRLYGIPTSTLSDRVKGKTGQISNSLGRATIIPPEMEKSLANCLRTIERWGWGLSRSEVLDLVQQFIKRNGLDTPFCDDRPGKDWFIGFRKRHGLSIKKAQPVEHLRKKMTDPFVISEYFSLLGDTLEKLKLDDPRRIWNMDETAVCLDPTKTKVVGGVGEPCTRTTAGSGRENITVLAAVNAAGEKLNPLVIYKAQNMYEQWMAEPNPEHGFELAYAATKRGWIESEAFYNYMSKIMIPSLSQERPVLIIYDGHTTHVDPRVVALAAENDITILKLPAHTSHLLQPLDLAVFKSFKNKWDMKLAQWQRQNVGLKLKKKQFAELFADVWHQTTSSVIQNGFKKGGNKYDPAAFKRWSEHVSKKCVKPLTELCLDAVNKCMTGASHDSNDQNVSNQLPASFEQLLLERVTQQPRTEANKNFHKLKRVAKGAEVITHTFLEQQKIAEISNSNSTETDLSKKKQTLKNKGKSDKKGKPSPISEQGCSNTSDTEIAGPSGLQVQHKNTVVKEIKIKSDTKGKPSPISEQGCSNTSDTEIAGPSGLQMKHENTVVKEKKKKTRKTKNTTDSSMTLTECNKNLDRSNPTAKGKGKGKKSKTGKENITTNKDQEKPELTRKQNKRKKRSPSIASTPDTTVISLRSESDIDSLPDAFFNDTDIFKQLTREQEINKIVKEMYDAEKIFTTGDTEKQKIDKDILTLDPSEKNSTSCQIISSPSETKKKVTVLSSIRFAPENQPFCLKNAPEAQSSHSQVTLNVIDKSFDIFTSHKKRINPAKANSDNEPKKRKQSFAKQCNQITEIDEMGEHDEELIKMLKVGDTVLCRYHTRGWKFYVGIIESVDLNTQCYTVGFYKNIVKKDFVKFVTPKRKDQDLVPICNIVKTIDLLQFNENPVEYTLMNDEDSIYF